MSELHRHPINPRLRLNHHGWLDDLMDQVERGNRFCLATAPLDYLDGITSAVDTARPESLTEQEHELVVNLLKFASSVAALAL